MSDCCFRADCVRHCILSALLGSALTLLFVAIFQLRRRGRDNKTGKKLLLSDNLIADEKNCGGCNPSNRGCRANGFASGSGGPHEPSGEGFNRSRFSGSLNHLDGQNRATSSGNSHAIDGKGFYQSTFYGSFNNLDGQNRARYNQQETYDRGGTNVTVLSEERKFLSDDKDIRAAQEFDQRVLSQLSTLEESKLLLHRTRAVSALASRLMAAPDEESCFDIASRLIVPLFQVDRCAYALLKDEHHFVAKHVAVKQRKHATKMGLEGKKMVGGGVVKPLKNSLVGMCAETLRQQYCPRTKESPTEIHRMAHSMGINTILATPILVSQNKFAGAIVISMAKEDAFAYHDKVLVQDIASMLGANIYAKRLRKAAERSNKIAREMLHSMIPPKVIEKIEVFWDENSDEYRSRKTSNSLASFTTRDSSSLDDSGRCSDPYGGESKGRRSESVSEKISFLNKVNAISDGDDTGIIVDTSGMEIRSLNRALYADNFRDVVIVFTDIVGFSKMATTMDPMEVMNMVQALFSHFDALCDVHNVQKLETIGDAYLVTSNLMDDHDDARDAATSALNMAKDMVAATQRVMIPGTRRNSVFESLRIRVGIHVGNVTCGVLGERLPKFSLFGNAMNVAARMEQAGKPNKIRVSNAFRSLVEGATEEDWGELEVISMKNMGDMGTYILDPLRQNYTP